MTSTITHFIGIIGATLTTGCWIPQAVRLIRTRDARAISIVGTTIFTTGVGCWLIYGIALANWPLIASNAVTLGLMLVIVGLKIRNG